MNYINFYEFEIASSKLRTLDEKEKIIEFTVRDELNFPRGQERDFSTSIIKRSDGKWFFHNFYHEFKTICPYCGQYNAIRCKKLESHKEDIYKYLHNHKDIYLRLSFICEFAYD